MRLIDADVLIQSIKERAGCRACNNYYGVQCRACLWNDAMNLVYEAPDAEKEEQGETDLISRAVAIKAFTGKPPEYYHTSYIVGELKVIPAVDAVPVVRCKDCKWRTGAAFWTPCQHMPTADDWYCGFGERRDAKG